MAQEISHAIHIRICELNDELKDARKDKKETVSKETEEALKINMHNFR